MSDIDEVKRLLGEARQHIRSEPGTSPERIQANRKLIDAQAVLENMEEGEAQLQIRQLKDANERQYQTIQSIRKIVTEPPTEEPELVGYIHGHPIHKAREEPEKEVEE